MSPSILSGSVPPAPTDGFPVRNHRTRSIRTFDFSSSPDEGPRRPLDLTAIPHRGIRLAIQYLHEHYDDDFRLEDVAASVALSKYYFSRLFHRSVGRSYQEYLTTLRVERAKELLASAHTLSITEIAYRTGFGSLRNFEDRFKAIAGMSPTRYKARAG